MKKKKFNKAAFRDIIITLVLIGITTVSICGVSFAVYINKYILPKADVDVSGLTMNLTSVVYYEDKASGQFLELEKLHGEQNRIWVGLDGIPKQLQNAFVSIEDERFYSHNGVDWKRTVGAALNWVLPLGNSFGGSTITQQLIKNITSDDDFKVTRKLTEIFRAINIEQKLSKDEILELYLNTIYFGRSAYGVSTAATTYFGKELSELNLAECAALAGITNNPSAYDPFRFPENTKKRQVNILNKMYELKKITKEELDEALAYELTYIYEENQQKLESKQSYFVDALIEDVIRDLMDQKGYSQQVAAQLLYSGGLEIYATVDSNIQRTMEAVYENESNYPKISGKGGELPQASMVVMDPHTGEVVGIVGGRGQKQGDRVLNRATQTLRQPGSTIKPIAVYAPAFDAGLITPITVFDDAPINFTDSVTGYPKNYYEGFKGRMTVQHAVLDSANTVAMKVLRELTTEKSYNFLTANLGVTTLNPKADKNLSPLSLGGLYAGMSVLEMTAAYAPFANDGYYIEPILYTKVTDADGNVILENAPVKQEVFKDPDTIYYSRQVLSSVVSSGTAAGSGVKVPNMQTIGKTGTTDKTYDLWFAGSTPYYTATTWFGYDNPQTINSTRAAQNLWKKVMHEIHKGLPAKNFSSEKNFVSVEYCIDSGHLATEYCKAEVRGSRVKTARVAAGDVPKETCNIHKPIPIDITTGGIATEFCPSDKIEERILMDLTRLFGKSIYLPDEQFTVSYENPPVGEGVPVLRSRDGTPTTYTGKPCEVHTEDNFVDQEEPELENPELEQPGIDEPEKPEIEEPEIETPETENPGLENPEPSKPEPPINPDLPEVIPPTNPDLPPINPDLPTGGGESFDPEA